RNAVEGQEACGPGGSSTTGLIGAMFSTVKSALTSTWNAMTKDGTLAAAGRQGADELGTALKAFPDSIQADEPGTLWNPTQGEIAASRNPDLPSPSEIAKSGKGGQADHSKEAASMSPSQAAKANTADLYGPEQARDQPLPSPGEIARDKGGVLTQEQKTWKEREDDRNQKASQDGNAENDQNERSKGRSLPEEEKQQERGRGR
ncbi:hypothetical protein HK102_008188, partial [Quaeritorhiza haematococci]